ncbi:MAG: hypothetical protein C0483_17840 [Pirellula sp.]|nr:hypothetical protein [Pirellula sp.]
MKYLSDHVCPSLHRIAPVWSAATCAVRLRHRSMRRRAWQRQFHRVAVFAAVCATSVAGLPLRAATYTWNQTAAGTYSWPTNANWSPAGFPDAVGDTANLNIDILGNQTINLDQPIVLGTLNIGDAAGTDTFALAGGYLHLDAVSGPVLLNKLTGGADTISTNIQFYDALTITNNSSGTLTISGGLRSINSDITLTGTGPGVTTISGVIGTGGGLTKTGSGTFLLSGANTYSGATLVSNGTLQISNAAALPARSAVTVAAGATLDYLNTATTIGSLSGGGTVTTSTASATRIFTIGRDDTSTTFSGRFLPTTVSRMAITKTGAGTLTLAPTAASTYTGATVINGGALRLDFSAGSLTSMLAGTPITIAGGNLEVRGRNSGAAIAQTVGALTIGATGGAIIMDANGSAIGTQLTTLAVTATAAGGTLLINAPANTNVRLGTAFTTVNARLLFTPDGTNYNWAINTGATTNTIALASGSYFDVAGLTPGGTDTNNSRIDSAIVNQITALASPWTTNTLKINADAAGQSLDLGLNNLTLTAGGLLFTGANDYTIGGSGGALNSSLGSNSEILIHHYGTGNLTLSANIGSGVGNQILTKTGPGKLTLTGVNSATGGVFVSGGILSFSNVTSGGAGSLGAGAATVVTIGQGATLQYTGATGTIADTGAGGHTYTLPGGNATIDVTNSLTTLTLQGAVTGGGGLIKLGPGVLILNGTTAGYLGTTFLNEGTLKNGAADMLSDVSPLVIASGATWDFASGNETVGSISGSGTIAGGTGTARTVTFGGDNTSTTFTGTFTGAAGHAMSKTGTGTLVLTLSAPNPWTGNKVVTSGTLRFGNANALASTGTVFVGNGTGPALLDLNNFNFTAAALTFYGTSTGATSQGTLTTGTGILTLSGALSVGNSGNPQAALLDASAGGLVINAVTTVSVADSTAVEASEAELTILGPISGTGGGITKTGGGNLRITGTNTTTGANTFNAGITWLDFATDNNAKLSSGALTMGGGTLVLLGNASAATTQNASSLTLTGAGFSTITLSPRNSQQIAMSVGAISRAASSGAIRFNLPSGTQNAANGILTTQANDANGLIGPFATVTDELGATNFATNLGGNIVGVTSTLQDNVTLWSGGQNISDSSGFTGTLDLETTIASLRFNAAGPSTVTISSGGLLRIDSGGILQTSNVTAGLSLITGGRLSSNTGNELIFTVDSPAQVLEVASAFSGATTISKVGNGTLRLSGSNNNYTGVTSIMSGTLQVSGGNAFGDASSLVFGASQGSVFELLSDETIGFIETGGLNQTGIVNEIRLNGNRLTFNQTGNDTFSGIVTSTNAGTLVKSGASTFTFQSNSSNFLGTFQVNQGQVTLSGNFAQLTGIAAIVLNGPASGMSILNDQNTASNNKINDNATLTLYNTAGTGIGFAYSRSAGTTSGAETLASLTLGAGHNVVRATAAGTVAGTLTFGTLASVDRHATVLVRGVNLGASSGNRGRIIFTTAPTLTLAPVGNGTSGTAFPVYPYMVGAVTDTGLGNSFVRAGDGTNGIKPLDLTNEYINDNIGITGSLNDNIRFTATAAITNTPTTINSLVLDSATGVALTGSASSMQVFSGAILAANTGAHSIAGISALTTGGGRDYTVYVTEATGVLTLTTPLTSAVPLVKSGAGTIVLDNVSNAFTDIYLNQGNVQTDALAKLGGGALNFFGGTLKFAGVFDPSSKVLSMGIGGGTFDTNSIDITFANAVGNGGTGGMTKAGAGNLTLGATTTYLGATTIAAGRLILAGGADDRILTTTSVVVSGGALQLGNVAGASNQSISELSGAGGLVGGNPVVSLLTVNQNTNTTFSGIIGGAGTDENNVGIVKRGSGVLTLGAVASTFTGGLVIKSGTVVGGNNVNTFGASTNVITLGDTTGSANAALTFFNSGVYANPIVVAAGTSGLLTIFGGTTTGSPNLSGGITLNNNLLLTKEGTTGTFTVSGGITGSGDLSIGNNGTTGAIALTTLAVNHSGSITNRGIATGTTTISANVGSNVTNIVQMSPTSALTLGGSSIGYVGATTVTAGTLNITGGAGAALTTNAITVAAGATLNLVNTAGWAVDLGSGALNLGAGTGTTTLAFELGSTSAYDRFTTSASATTANSIVFNLTGLSGFGTGNYDLLTAAGGLNGATYSLGSLGGTLLGVTLGLNTSDTLVQLAAAASTGDFYWKGGINSSWRGNTGITTNWTTDLAGNTNANGTPGIATDVIFSTTTQTATTLSTTLDGAFSIGSLAFNNAVGSGPLLSIAIAPGTGGTLTITPTLPTAGIDVATGAPPTITLSAPIILGASQTWTVADALTALVSSGGITGTGNLTKSGDGILTLSGTNSYVGTTTINAGILQAAATNGLNQTSAHILAAAATLRLNNFNTTIGSLAGSGLVENGGAANRTLTVGGDNSSTIFSGTSQNTGAGTLGIAKTGSGTFTLSGIYSHTGNTTLSAGTLNITGTWTGNTTASTLSYGSTAGNTIVNVSGNVTAFATTGGNILGSVAIYNQTAGTVTLSPGTGDSQYVARAAGSYGYFNLTGGVYKVLNRFDVNGSANLGSALDTATASVGVVYVGGDGFLDHTGGEWFINGYSMGQITVAGNGMIDHTGATQPFAIFMNSTTAGGTFGVLNVAGGSVTVGGTSIRFGNSTTNGSGNSGFINLADGTLSVGTAITQSVNAAGGNNAYLNFVGGTLQTSVGVSNWIPASSAGITYTATLFGAVDNTSATGDDSQDFAGGLVFDSNGANSSLSNIFVGASGAGVTQSNLTVTGGSGYVGAPAVVFSTAGVVAGGTPASGYALISGGAVVGIVITNPGTYTPGTVPTITLMGGGGTGAAVTAGALNTANVSGGLTKINGGTLTLSGANTYTGGTTITGGILALGAAGVLADTGNVTINGGTFDVATFAETVGTVSLQSGSINGTTGILTASADYDLRSGTVAAILAGGVGVIKSTVGTVTLGGLNTFSGPVNVNSGVLAFSTSGNLGNASATNTVAVNGGTLRYTASTTLDLGANRVLTVAAAGATLDVTSSTGVLQFSAGVDAASSGSLIKLGPGTVILANTTNLNGGAVTVSDGALRAGFGVGGISALTVGASGVMNFGNGAVQALGGLSGLTLANGSRLAFELDALLSDSLAVTNPAVVSGTVILDFINFGAGVSATTYNLISAPSGLLGANFVLGAGINGWNLVINRTDSLVSLTASPFLPIYWRGGQNASWNTLGAGTANWTSDSNGTVDSAHKPLPSETVVFSALGTPFTSTTVITTTLDAAFTIDSLVFDSVPAGVTAVTINPGTGGTLELAPVSSSSGIEIRNNAGTITIAAPLTASSPQTWQVSAVGASLVVSGNTTFTSSVNKTGAGMLTLSGANSGAGGITLTDGTLNINTATALGTGTLVIGSGTTINNSSGAAVTLSTNNVQTWNGNFTFTGTQSLNLGAGGVTLTNNTVVTGAAGTLTVGGAIGQSGGNRGLGKAGAGTLVLNGANTYDGLTDLSGGILTLNGDNTDATGGVMMAAATTLNINHAGALGTGLFTINGGIINNLSGAAIVNANNNSQVWNGSFVFTGGSSYNLGTGSVLLGANVTVTTTANTLTVGGVINDGINSFNLNKDGAGTLVLSGLSNNAADNYSGTTTLVGGTTTIATNTSLSGGLTFGTSAGTIVSTLDLSSANLTIGGAMLVQTNSSSQNTITLGAGRTLTNNANVTIGSAGTGTNARLTVAGATSAWNVSGTNLTFRVGGSSTATGTVILTMTNLGSFTTDLGTAGAFRVGSADGGSATDTNTALLAVNSTIQAGTLDVGGTTTRAGTATLTMGTGQTNLFANTFNIGSFLASGTTALRSSGAVNFANPTQGSVTVRGENGTAAATLNMINSTTNTGTSMTSTLSLAGHSADLLLGTLTMASRNPTANTTTQTNVSTLTFDQGTFAATTAVLSNRAGSSFTTGGTTANLTLGGTTAGTTVTLGTVTMSQNSASTADSSGNAAATIDIGGIGTTSITTLNMGSVTLSGVNATGGSSATVNIAGSTTTIGAINMAVNSATAAVTTVTTAASTLNISAGTVNVTGNISMGNTTVNALNVITNTINITGGSLTVGGNIAYTNGLGVENVTLALNGGLLDMTSGNIGAAGAFITFNAQSGTLRNLAELNAGGATVNATLDKTTTGTLLLDTLNSYTGFTTVTAGVLQIRHGSALGGTARGTTVAGTGAALEISNNITTLAEALTLNGTGISDDGALRSAAGNNTYAGNITLASAARINSNGAGDTLTLDVASGNAVTGADVDLTFGGIGNIIVADAIALGAGGLTKDGVGILSLNVANNYAGLTTVSAGVLAVAHGGALGGTTNGTSVAAGGTLSLSGNITVAGELLSLSAGAGGNAALNNQSGNNTWTGNLTVDTGTDGANRAVLNSDAGTLTISGDVNLAAGAQDFVLRGDGNGEISGQITGGQRLFKSSVGTGTWILSGDNSVTFTGRTSVGNGTLQIASEANLGASPGAFAANQLTLGGGATKGTLKTTGSTSLSANRGVTLSAGGGAFDVAAATKLTVNSGVTGAGALFKESTGILVLNGTNNYAGSTTVNAGVLTVNGTLAGSDVLVAAGATLNGGAPAATPGAAINAAAAITIAAGGSPAAGGQLSAGANDAGNNGNGVGRLDVGTGGIVLGNNSSLVFDFNQAVGVEGTNWDYLNVAGTVTLGTNLTLYIDSWTLNNAAYGKNEGGNAPGPNDFNPEQPFADAYQWKWMTTNGILGQNEIDNGNYTYLANFNVVDSRAGTGVFSNTAYGPGTIGGQFWVSAVGNSLYVNYSAVPEPGSLLLISLAGIGFAGYRRRKRKLDADVESSQSESIASK